MPLGAGAPGQRADGLSLAEFARLFALKPEAAVAYLKQRGKLTETFDWRDLWQDEHAQQFTVSRLARLDLLKAIQDGITQSVEGDLSRRDWTRDIKALLTKEGWWGEKEVLDPVTGKLVKTTFDPARLKLIYDTNTNMAYSAGLWERIERNKRTSPYIRYITKRDERVRITHRAWDNLALPVDHPFWNTHFPPNGWRCRCRAMSMSQAQYDDWKAKGRIKTEALPIVTRRWVDKRSGEIHQIPVGIDPGFNYNPGKAGIRAANIQQQVRTKSAGIEDMPGATPRFVNKLLSDLTPSDILKVGDLDSGLLQDIGAVKAAEYYINQVRASILNEIKQGGLTGSSALAHELAEVQALEKAGLDIFEPGDLAKIISAWTAYAESGYQKAAALVPWHLAALKAELEYVQGVLRAKGVEITLGEAARVAYPGLTEAAEEKMIIELAAIGETLPAALREEIVRAL